jgi:drug/metabolite transporter (DMT)-like permease
VTVALAAAGASALCYGAGSVLEQIGARREAPAANIDPRLLLRLARRLPWLAGAGLDVAGWLLSLVALRTLPLFAVQSAVAGSVGVTALLSAVAFGVRPGRRQRRALLALGAGLVLLGAAAAPDGPGHLEGAARALLVAGPAAVTAAGLVVARSARGETGAARLGILAGLAFSGVALAGHVLQIPSQPVGLLEDPLAWALAAYGLLGTLLFALALQRGSATSASAAVFATETAIPALVGLVLLGDRARPALGPLAAAGFVATVGGAVFLALEERLPRTPRTKAVSRKSTFHTTRRANSS